MELAHGFLRGAYPEQQGWNLSRNTMVKGTEVAFVLQNQHRWILVPALTNEPFVSLKNVTNASCLKDKFLDDNEGSEVQVILMYGNLLFPPGKLPKNVVVVSMQQDDKQTEGLGVFQVGLN